MHHNSKDDVPSLLGAVGTLLEMALKAAGIAFEIVFMLIGALFTALIGSCGLN